MSEWTPAATNHRPRDLRDPTILGNHILSRSPHAQIVEACYAQTPNYDSTETSQSAAQRAYREEHERKAAMGIKASVDLIAYLDDPIGTQAHPGSDAADVDTRPHVNGSVPTPEASSSQDEDLSSQEGE